MGRYKNSLKPGKRPRLTEEGVLGRLSYFLGRAVANIQQNLFASLVTTATIALALLIVSLMLLVFVNLEEVAAGWSDRVQVTAYFPEDLAPVELARLKGAIEAISGTAAVRYVSRDEALKRFRDRLKGQESLLEGVSAEVLPASLEISLKRSFRTAEGTEAYVASLNRISGIGEVQYGEEWLQRFTTFLTFMRLLAAVIGCFLLLAVTFIVSNTIKLTVYSRRDELELLSLVGATRFFIKAPFFLEGFIQGAAGAVIALLLLFGSWLAFFYNAENFLAISPTAAGLTFLPVAHVIAIVAGGAFLGLAGSMAALKRLSTF
jgi:cell division transport system permease protein